MNKFRQFPMTTWNVSNGTHTKYSAILHSQCEWININICSRMVNGKCFVVESVGSCALLSLQNHKTLSKHNMNHLRPWHLYISYPYNTASFEYIAAITITSSPLPHYKAKRHLWALYDIAITIATLHGSVTMFILITSPPSLWTAFLHFSHAFQIRRK